MVRVDLLSAQGIGGTDRGDILAFSSQFPFRQKPWPIRRHPALNRPKNTRRSGGAMDRAFN